MVQFKNVSFVDLLDSISSNSPVPGGGSVSALLLSLAGALSRKVCSISKKQGYLPEYNDKCASIIQKGLELAEEDADKYLKVIESFRHKTGIKDSLHQAALTPLKISFEGLAFMDIALDLSLKGNSKAITDALISSLMAQIATLGGILNARINLEEMPPGSLRDEIISCLKEIINNYRSKERQISAVVDSYLKTVDTFE
ncbi:MAG: hypothetical protein DDT40_00085 [candidate division WS2 bacterium]|nr:hypothetical protein [Candidatus Psychracetigena formicireducens]